MNYIEFQNNIAFHPGYYIKEIIQAKSISQEAFAENLDVKPNELKKIISGEQRITAETEEKLSRLIGTSTAYWMNLQNRYDEQIAEFKRCRA